jgi:hypothetical protein
MPRRSQNGGRKQQLIYTPQNGGRKRKLHKWAVKSKQRGGFIFATLALIGSMISAGVAAAAPAVATAAVGAAAAYGTTKALEAIGGKGRRKVRVRRR